MHTYYYNCITAYYVQSIKKNEYIYNTVILLARLFTLIEVVNV